MHTYTAPSRGARPAMQNKHKKTFRIQCLSPELGVEPKTVPIPAASWSQALWLASIDRELLRYTDFGLVNEDGQIHRWRYRHGEARAKTQTRDALMREQLENLFAKKAAKSEAAQAPESPPKEETERLDSMSPSLMAKELIEAIPHMAEGVEFMARELAEKAPQRYRHLMKAHHLSFAMEKLVSSGVVLRTGRVRYMRNPAYIIKTEAPPPVIETPEVTQSPEPVAAAPEVAPAVAPPEPAPIVIEPPRPSVSASMPPQARADIFFQMADHFLLNREEKEQKMEALGKRVMDALELIEGIRSDLAALIRDRVDTHDVMSQLARQFGHEAKAA